MPTAIIIGASSGIGREIALQLAAKGYSLGIGARRVSLLDEISRQVAPHKCIYRMIDLTEIRPAMIGFQELVTGLGHIDEIYLVAGTGFPNPNLDWALEEGTLQVNCAGFAGLAVGALKQLEAQRKGQLVVITSVAAARPWSVAPAYGASKAFESVYCRALRMRVRKLGHPIFVTEVRPGFVDTAMMKAPKPFWMVSAKDAAAQIIIAAHRRARIAYVPRRWALVAWVLRMLPDSIIS